MLPTLIQRYDKKSFHFKNERLNEFYRLSGATFYDCINTIYQFIKSFLDIKMSIFEEYGAFKPLTSPVSFSTKRTKAIRLLQFLLFVSRRFHIASLVVVVSYSLFSHCSSSVLPVPWAGCASELWLFLRISAYFWTCG